MRSTALAAALGAIAAGACAGRPLSPTRAAPAAAAAPRASDPMPPEDPPTSPIRVVSAPPIRAVSASPIRVVSAPPIRAVSAAAPYAPLPAPSLAPAPASSEPPCDIDRAQLRAPHRGADPPPPPPRAPLDLRDLVGRRDPRDSLTAVAAWSRALGAPLATPSGAALLSWATESRRLFPATEPPLPGDLLVFHRALSDAPADLIALVLDRDARGVTEFLYVASGVIRRGLVDASRPAVHRDARGATVNTYLRHVRRWPARGQHYLAGELLGHVVHMR
jgi:hypothetical protein